MAPRSTRVITILPDAVLAWIGGAGRGLDYKDLMDAEKSHDVFVGGLTQKANSAQQRPSQPKQKGNGQGQGKPTGKTEGDGKTKDSNNDDKG